MLQKIIYGVLHCSQAPKDLGVKDADILNNLAEVSQVPNFTSTLMHTSVFVLIPVSLSVKTICKAFFYARQGRVMHVKP